MIITSYGKDIEPNFIDKYTIIDSTKALAKHLGKLKIQININEKE